MAVKPFQPQPLGVPRAALQNRIIEILPGDSGLTLLPMGNDSFSECGRLGLSIGGTVLNLSVGSLDLLALDEDLREINPLNLTPELRAAALELALEEPLRRLGEALDSLITCRDPVEDGQVAAELDFCYHAQGISTPLRLSIGSISAVQLILGRLSQVTPQPRLPSWQGEIIVEVPLLAARARMGATEINGLGAGDLIIPDQSPLLSGRLLAPLGRQGILLSMGEGQGTVEAVLSDGTEDFASLQGVLATMTDNNNTAPAGQPAAAVDTSALELRVAFELERKAMSIAEIGSLGVGSTIPLGCDRQSPVTIRVNDLPVGKGRLCELDGQLAVQVTELRK
ncbi:MAG: FliM/FliN family flagellar motor switch protein [Succinivibrionaceae bacterium]|nr:FliM/FliN family flagellar motor switch protein [Succinivibrionaceae bacterium]